MTDSQRERMLSGALYQANDPDLVVSRQHCQRILEVFNTSRADDDENRQHVLDKLLGSLGAGTVILPRFQCDTAPTSPSALVAWSTMTASCWTARRSPSVSHVQIAPRVQLLTATHPVDDHEARRNGWESASPITIGDNAWLGAGAIVCPGVTVGDNAVIGAGSVVIRDIPANVVAVGNPCRIIRSG